MEYAREILPEKLAEQGWNDQEIKQLEMELELAIQKAKKESYDNGETLARQKDRMKKAEKQARKIAHDRMHAKLEKMMEDIAELGDKKEIPEEAKH
jgi:hypothetical protein